MINFRDGFVYNKDSDFTIPDTSVTNNTFTTVTENKNQAQLNVILAQIAVLQAQIDSAQEQSTDSFTKIALLQDSKRLIKKHTNFKSRVQLDNENLLNAQIGALRKEYARLASATDDGFGDRVTKNVVTANTEYFADKNERIKQKELSDYEAILDDFDSNTFDKNRKLQFINDNYKQEKFETTSVVNSYIENGFDKYANGEQDMTSRLIEETININGMSVRYLPRHSDFEETVFNEEPESYYHRGFMLDAMLMEASGFAGEGHAMTHFGLEFKEEMELAVGINRFSALSDAFEGTLTPDELAKFSRTRPLEGDLIIVPFGKTSGDLNDYTPKVFIVNYVNTYKDGVFFRLDDLYQYRLKCILFDASAEEINFNPVIHRNGNIIVDDNTGYNATIDDISDRHDSDNFDISDSDADINDSYAENEIVERRSQFIQPVKADGSKLATKVPNVIGDYTSKSFGVSKTVLTNLDDI